MRRKEFNIFVPSGLDLWPLDLKYASPVNFVQRYVFTELEVTMAFPISTKSEAHDEPTDGQTCGVQQNAVS